MRGGGQATNRVERHAGFDIVVRLVRRDGTVRGRILFVNGAATTLAALRWAEHGLTEFDLLTFDFPMMGRSLGLDPRAKAMDRAAETEIVASLIERHAPDYLSSVSWGGASALAALARRPPSVKRAAIASFSAGLSKPLERLCQELTTLIDSGQTDEAARRTVDSIGERLPDALRRAFRRFCLGLNAEQAVHLRDHMLELMGARVAERASELAAIEIPVLFVNGAKDRYTPPKGARAFEGLIGDARFLVAPDAGHFLAMESPETARLVCEAAHKFFSVA